MSAEKGHSSGAGVSDRAFAGRHAQYSLQVSEARYRRLFETCQDGILIVNAQTGRIEEANPYLADLLGYASKDIQGLHLWEIGAFRNPGLIKEALGEMQRKGYLRYESVPLKTKDGRPIEVEFAGNIYEVDGTSVIQFNIRDITARKQAETAVKESEEKYRALMDNASDGIVINDLEGNILEVNKKMEVLLGYTKEELLGMNFLRIHPPEEHEIVTHNFRERVEGKPVRLSRTKVLRKDGTSIPVDITGTVIELAGRKVLQASFRDITERRKAEELLEQTSNELRALIETMSDIVLVIDRKGRCTEVIPTRASRSYRDINRLAGKTFKQTFPEATAELLLDAVKEVLKTGRTVNVESRLDLGGETLWFADAISPRTSDSVLLVARNITELKRAEAELEAKSAALEETNAALKMLIKNMEEAKKDLEDNIASNIKTLVMPYVQKIRNLQPGESQVPYIDLIETNLEKIVSPFLRRLDQYGLTPTEIQVANLVRDGRTTKEIMALMHSSKGAIDIHRYNIRRKLGINKKKVNIRSHLLSLQQ
jgi:PAS domain S-box-containing protein